jgi:hypothetical protein
VFELGQPERCGSVILSRNGSSQGKPTDRILQLVANHN